MSVEYRADRSVWIFRVMRGGKRYKKYGFSSRDEALTAERRFLAELELQPRLPRTSLLRVAELYVSRGQRYVSERRRRNFRYNLDRFILRFFGAATPVTEITSERIEDFLSEQLCRTLQVRTKAGLRDTGRPITKMTVWHIIKDLRALLNWAVRQNLLAKSPLDKVDCSPLRGRFTPKPPLSLADFDRAASCLTGNHRLYFDTLRYMGLRKDEGNRLQAKDLREADGGLWLEVRGTKTASSHRFIPVPPIITEELRAVARGLAPEHYIFGRQPSWSRREPGGNGGPVIVKARRKLFERIKQATGLPLKPKDLRDYFASIVSDPLVASKMMGHTSLSTTAIYTRQVRERMVAGVASIGKPG